MAMSDYETVVFDCNGKNHSSPVIKIGDYEFETQKSYLFVKNKKTWYEGCGYNEPTIARVVSGEADFGKAEITVKRFCATKTHGFGMFFYINSYDKKHQKTQTPFFGGISASIVRNSSLDIFDEIGIAHPLPTDSVIQRSGGFLVGEILGRRKGYGFDVYIKINDKWEHYKSGNYGQWKKEVSEEVVCAMTEKEFDGMVVYQTPKHRNGRFNTIYIFCEPTWRHDNIVGIPLELKQKFISWIRKDSNYPEQLSAWSNLVKKTRMLRRNQFDTWLDNQNLSGKCDVS